MGTRKYFLDWLRVSAFGFLILFHVGMLYVTWGYNLKSPRLVPGIEWLMNALGAWRMALLFFISGVACRFLIAKLGPGGFTLDRLKRLLPVILFGMFVVIPPQTWIELVSKGVTHQGYLQFWLFSYLPADQTLVRPLGKTMPTWDHLWFLVYLLVYTLVFALLASIRRLLPSREPVSLPVGILLIGPAVWLVMANFAILRAPLTHALVNDWAGHLKWVGMFSFGAAAAANDRFWETLRRHRAMFTVLALALLVVQNNVNDPWWSTVSGFYAWTMICALAGYTSQYLNRPSALLSHLNEAVLPIYVLHQPVLLFAAFMIFPLHLALAQEAIAIIATTALGVFAIYELTIRPFAIMRFLFGLKPKAAGVRQQAAVEVHG
jgi:hypothetical protein